MSSISSNVLMKQIMYQMQTLDSNVRSFAGERSETSPENESINRARMVETRIYVGLNDADTKAQKHDTQKYIRIL